MTDELESLVRSSPWFLGVLATVRASGLPQAWVGAGALRDLVWGARFGNGFDPTSVRDVDVAFFDPADLSPEHDKWATGRLRELRPEVPWEATNQAAVHTWYPAAFGGGPVAPLVSSAEGIASWPETATAVGLRLDDHDRLEVCAPFGVEDLLGGVWRRNEDRVTVEHSRKRLARHRPAERWPGVTVIPPG